MALDISQSLKDGFRNVFTRDGVLLTVIFTMALFMIELFYRSLRVNGFESTQYRNIDPSGTYLLPDGPMVDTLASNFEGQLFLLLIAALTLPIIPTIMSFRAFTAKKMLPDTWKDLVEISFYLLLANLIVSVGVIFGSLFFVLPGIFLAVALIFFPVFVCAERRGIESLKDSWLLSKGNRIRIFGLMLVLLIITSVPSLLAYSKGLSFISIYLSGIETVLGISVICAAYNQLRGEIE
jgi:hypothetical protein